MMRNSYFTFRLIVLLFSSISMIGYSQSTKSKSKISNAVALKIKDSIIAPKPVSSELFGGMSAVSDGRPENMLSQMLFDRGFELTRSTFDNTDFQGLSVGDKKQKGTGKWESDGWKNATWWHSGYEENCWYFVKDPKDELSNFSLGGAPDGLWPAGIGDYFARVTNKSKEHTVYLAQDGIRVRKGISYTFSGLLCDGTHFSATDHSSNPVKIIVGLYPEGKLDLSPISSAEIIVDKTCLSNFTIQMPACTNDCRATFAISVPSEKRLSLDMLSLEPSDNVEGFRADVIEAMKKVTTGPIRWPGGCDASTYDWRSGIGNRDKRTINRHTFWGLEDLNDIGTVEFVKLCRLVGVEPMICVPVMFGSPENSADWVAFCNAPTHLLRPNSGVDGPLKVKYWEMENEMYRLFDAVTYAKRVVDFSKSMKAVDPSIKIIMANYWIYHKAFKEMLEIAGPYIDVIVNRGGSIKEIQEDAVTLAEYNKKNNRDITICDSEYNAHEWDPIGKCAQDDKQSKTLLEAGALQPVRKNKNERSYFDKKCRWAYSMGVLSDFMDYQNLGGAIQFINFFCTTDFWGTNLINCGKDKVYFSANGQAINFLKEQAISWPIAVSNSTDNVSYKSTAAWNKEKSVLTIVILNYQDKEKEFSLDVSAFNKKFDSKISVDQIYATSGDDFNTETKPSTIIRENKLIKANKTTVKYTCKPFSATAIRLEIKK